MPRPRKRAEQWSHPLYSIGFCYNRNGIIYTEINGTRKTTQLTWHKKNKKHALEILEKRIVNHLNPVIEKSTAENPAVIRTVYELIAVYRENRVKYKSKTSQNEFRYACLYFLPNDNLLSDIVKIENTINKALETTHLHPNSVQRKLYPLKKMFKYAIERRFMVHNPVISDMIPTKIKSNLYIPSNQNVRQLLKSLKNSNQIRTYYTVMLIWYTGVRIREAIEIQRNEIFEDYFIIHGKDKKNREFPLQAFSGTKKLLDKIKNQYSSQTLLGVKSYAYLERRVTQHVRNLGLPAFNFHAIRKRFENNLLYLGISANLAAQILGHTRRIQDQHYLEVTKIDMMNILIEKERSN